MKLKIKTYNLYAVEKMTNDYIFIMSINADSLKTARQFAQKHAIELHRKYPHYNYDFRWEQDNV